MTRRVHEDRQPEAAPVQRDDRGESPPDPRRPMRVAGVVHAREVNEVERIAGALEVATWIQRVSFIARPAQKK